MVSSISAMSVDTEITKSSTTVSTALQQLGVDQLHEHMISTHTRFITRPFLAGGRVKCYTASVCPSVPCIRLLLEIGRQAVETSVYVET